MAYIYSSLELIDSFIMETDFKIELIKDQIVTNIIRLENKRALNYIQGSFNSY